MSSIQLPQHLVNNVLSNLPLDILEQYESPMVKSFIMNKIKKDLFLPEIFNRNVYLKYKEYFDELLLEFSNSCAEEYMKPVDNAKDGLDYIYEIIINYRSN